MPYDMALNMEHGSWAHGSWLMTADKDIIIIIHFFYGTLYYENGSLKLM